MEKLKDGIIGLAIGDALGVPAEFKSREELTRDPITDMKSDGTYNVPAGTWSDDTSMTLATLHSIIEKGIIDTNDMADKFLKWFRNAEYTATNETFDIGRTTLQALSKYEFKLEQSTTNRFYDVINVKISNIESNYGGKASLNNLAAGISNLFLSGSPSEEDKHKAENLYKKNTGKEVSFINLKNDMDSDRGIYTDICTYYEYIQFKRAHFNCTDSKYNERTGRIIDLDFEFNGKIE